MKRKVKKAIPMILLVAALMVLAACGGKSNSATGTTVPDPVLTDVQEPSGNAVDSAVVTPEETAGSEISETVEPEPVVEPIAEPEPEDPYAVLEVSEAEARAAGGFFLKRGDKLYSLNSTAGKNSLYATALAGDGIVTMGDIPLIVVEEDDQIISFGYTGMALYEFELYGDSLRIGQADKYYSKAWCIYDGNGAVGNAKRRTNLEVHDEDGNLIEDCNNVERGKTYVVSWFEGTDYYEIEMLANCYCYKLLGLYSKYSLDGALSKESYAAYDISGVEPGIWQTRNGGFFRIP